MKLAWMGIVLLVSGCANFTAQQAMLGLPQSCPVLDQDQQLSLSLANEMVVQGRRYAALAHLQKMPQQLPQIRLGQAKILRSLSEPQAEELYRGLLSSCLAADAEHGLGQLAAQQNLWPKALTHLERARQLAPTNAQIRNDLGVVYLTLGRESEARFEFITALELEQSNQQPAENLLALLLYQGREDAAADLAQKLGLSAQVAERAKALAQRLKQNNSAQRALQRGPDLASKEES